MGEGFANEVVGAHAQAEEFVDLLIFRREEDHRHLRLLAQTAQQLHPVHARHLDIEDSKVGRRGAQTVEGGHTISVSVDLVALRFEEHA